MTFFIEE